MKHGRFSFAVHAGKVWPQKQVLKDMLRSCICGKLSLSIAIYAGKVSAEKVDSKNMVRIPRLDTLL
jgi:hypothetical protein